MARLRILATGLKCVVLSLNTYVYIRYSLLSILYVGFRHYWCNLYQSSRACWTVTVSVGRCTTRDFTVRL